MLIANEFSLALYNGVILQKNIWKYKYETTYYIILKKKKPFNFQFI